MFKGIYFKNSENGFVKNEFNEIKNVTQPSTAFEGDIVGLKNDKLKIIKRNINIIYGVFKLSGPIMKIVKPGKIVMKIFIPNNNNLPHFLVKTRKIISEKDEYGEIKFLSWNDHKEYPIGIYHNKIGAIGNYEDEKLYFMYIHNIKWKNYVYNINDYKKDLTPERIIIDKTDIISIDPSGCTDIDDALHIQKIKLGYEIGIHIADVSSYININSIVDMESSKRCESLYLNWKQYNMLPNELVNNISLFKFGYNNDYNYRRAFSILVYIDNDGNIINYTFKKTKIKVTNNLSYEDAELKKNHNNTLKILYDIGKLMSKYSDYNMHKMVEYYMILANELVAEKIKNNNAIFRTHNGIIKNSYTEDFLINNMINTLRLESAEYTLEKKPHKIINNKLYVHFTSPIRRYVDIINHRILYNTIMNEEKKVFSDDIRKYMSVLNKKNKHIKKANRDSIILDFINDKYKSNCNIINNDGYIVRIKEDNILVYCNNIKQIIKCRLYTKNIKQLIKIDYNEFNITLISNDKKIKLNLGQKVKLDIIITMLGLKLKDKIFGQLIEPNINSLFNLPKS